MSCTAVPFSSISLGKTTFQITTSVGKCLHTYDLRRGLNLVFLTRPQTPSDITSIFSWKDRVFAAWGGEASSSAVGVWVFKRGRKVEELEIPPGISGPISQILIFGSWIVGCTADRVEVWKSATYEHYTTITPTGVRNIPGGAISSGGLTHMPTYLNKIFVGKRDGSLEIWNLSTGKLIYAIVPPSSTSGPVTALQPTPALSLLAVARANGSISIHDIRSDRVIIELNSKRSRSSTITSISFRTDGLGAGADGRKPGIMATAGPDDGDVTLWDLNNGGRVSGVLRGAHNPASSHHSGVLGGINKVEFLPGQDIIITGGLDNALKSWIFDATSLSATPRILHSRSGHAAPVTCLSFLPSNAEGSDAGGKWLLSAGRDQSLWGWSLRRDGQSTELSQGNIRKQAKKLGILGKSLDVMNSTTLEDLKAPEITCIACSLNRDGGMGASGGGGAVWTNVSTKKGGLDATQSAATGWESIVTGHRGDKYARTWFWGRKKAGRWAFETADGEEVTVITLPLLARDGLTHGQSVAVTACGTFAVVGSAGGSISMFNLQSGIHRQRFPSTLTPGQAKRLKLAHAVGGDDHDHVKFALGEGKHKKAVTGLMVDTLNRTVISCGLDGKIKFWDFLTGRLEEEIDWYPMAAITASRYYRPSDLIALSCDDLSIRVVDSETKKVVRELWGCLGQVSDFSFSNDGRWIIAASMDSVVRVWDLPTGHLINALRMESPCTALAFSDTGEFLATAHADGVGINIWNNRTLFMHVPTRQIRDNEITDAIAPTSSGEGGRNLIDAAFDEDEENDPIDESSFGNFQPTTSQLSDELQTLSLVPKSRWQNLLHIDTITQRNKPIVPPKPPERAPFFLPSLSETQTSASTPSAVAAIAPASSLKSRITKVHNPTSSTPNPFTALLHSSSQPNAHEPFIDHLSSLPPSAADIQIRSLSPLPLSLPSTPSSTNELMLFVRVLTARLRQKRDYELVQTWMAVFLKVHGESVIADLGLREVLREWRAVQGEEASRLTARIGFCSGVVAWARSER